MGKQLFANNCSATVSGGLTISGTTLVLGSGLGAQFPSPSGDDYFIGTLYEKDVAGNEVFIEIAKVTSRTGDTLTIERNVENTGSFAYPSIPGSTVYFELRWTAAAAANAEQQSAKDAASGYVGLTADFKARLKNAAGLITSWLSSSATVARTWIMPDKDGTVAMLSDITGTNSGTNTGDNSPNSLYAGLVSNANHTGDASGSGSLTVTGINGTHLAGLATGILKNTNGTGVPSIAVASDFPTLNQNTTGTAGGLSAELAVDKGGTGATTKTGTGANVLGTGPSIGNPTITNYTETRNAPAAGSAFTIDLANGTIHRLTTNANATITLPDPVDGKSYVVEVSFGGAHTLTFAGGGTRRWEGGTAPTPTSVSGKIDRYVFSCDATQTFGSDGGRNF